MLSLTKNGDFRCHRVVDQVTEHCLECVGLDMEIGKGMADQQDARKEVNLCHPSSFWSTMN